MTNQEETQAEPRPSPRNEGRISIRFRSCNIAFFVLTSCIMVLMMLTVFRSVVARISAGYAARYATSAAGTLSANVAKEIALMAKAARSKAVVNWLADEEDEAKKALAYDEMLGILGELHSLNLYAGVKKSRHEYRIDKGFTAATLRPFDTLREDDPEDTWYFDCISSDKAYLLSIGIDHVLGRKRVWLDYKVGGDGDTGVLCTGLEFAHVAGALFSTYNHVVRGLIVNADGIVLMDSAQMKNDEFLRGEFETRIDDQISDQPLLAAVKDHLEAIEGYFEETPAPVTVNLPPAPYRFATIAPIRYTDWSAVILFDSSSSFNLSLFLPAIAAMFALLVAFAFVTNALGNRLIFSPLSQLVHSLARLKEDKDERIYGIDRDDEFGELSNTILDLFTQANHDALTGLYNRRCMESELERAMKLLSRSDAPLSVLMVDVDFFKKYNDTYGHEEGDVCLRKIARTLTGCITRRNDFVARYGGEEFFAVLPNTDEAGARVIAQKMLENVRELALPHANSSTAPYVTVSIGAATGTVMYWQSWEDYSKRADEALYMSKQNGRDRYTYLDLQEDGRKE